MSVWMDGEIVDSWLLEMWNLIWVEFEFRVEWRVHIFETQFSAENESQSSTDVISQVHNPRLWLKFQNFHNLSLCLHRKKNFIFSLFFMPKKQTAQQVSKARKWNFPPQRWEIVWGISDVFSRIFNFTSYSFRKILFTYLRQQRRLENLTKEFRLFSVVSSNMLRRLKLFRKQKTEQREKKRKKKRKEIEWRGKGTRQTTKDRVKGKFSKH